MWSTEHIYTHSLNFIYGHGYDYIWLTDSLNFIYGHGYDYVWLTNSLNFIYESEPWP
jgi:hypothetical protein